MAIYIIYLLIKEKQTCDQNTKVQNITNKII